MSFDERAAEMRQIFFESAQEMVQALDEQALALEKSPGNTDAVQQIRRLVHTLKGDSAACGFREMSTLAHDLEDVLRPNGDAPADPKLAELVLSATEMFDALLTAYRNQVEAPSCEPLRTLIRRLKGAERTRSNWPPEFDWTEYERMAAQRLATRGLHIYGIAVQLDPHTPMRTAALQLARRAVEESGTVLGARPENITDPLAVDALAFLLASEHDQKWIEGHCRVPTVVNALLVQPWAEEARSPNGSGGSGAQGSPAGQPENSAKPKGPSVKVAAERIDSVLNLMGELILSRSMLQQVVSDLAVRAPKDPLRSRLTDVMAFQSQVLNQLQDAVLRIRMVPMEQLVRRMPRLLRDTAEECGKKVNLVVEGEQTEIDKSLLDALAEPLSHLLRNAVDHGIESPQERTATGKPPQGTIRIRAHHQAQEVVIEVSDDGRGIDISQVVEKARARNLISAEVSKAIDEHEALELIFRPGFSTSNTVTSISGRGVGLDVVRHSLQQLKGSVTVETRRGRGTSFILRLPLTLAMIKALLFRIANTLYAAPLSSVAEIARVPASDLHFIEGREVLWFRQQTLPVIRVGGMRPVSPQKNLMVLVVEVSTRHYALLVDNLLGEEELVIKPLDETLVLSPLVTGASVLGDGRVVLLLNLSAAAQTVANRAAPAAPLPLPGVIA